MAGWRIGVVLEAVRMESRSMRWPLWFASLGPQLFALIRPGGPSSVLAQVANLVPSNVTMFVFFLCICFAFLLALGFNFALRKLSGYRPSLLDHPGFGGPARVTDSDWLKIVTKLFVSDPNI